MATFSTTNILKTTQALALTGYLTDISISGSLYLMVSKGNPYTNGDTLPDDLPIEETATVLDITDPLFFKKVNLSGANTSIQYVVPDDNGTINMYKQRYTDVPEADIFTLGVRHVYMDIEIPANDILVSDTVRSFSLVSDLYTSGGSLATGDSYLASEINLTNTLGNRLLYLENRETYQRVETQAGEIARILFAI